MERGFQGNKENFYDPENSFIDRVIEKKLGNPILLSMIYLLVTKRIGLSFSGVNMPAHFLVQYRDVFEPIFIDPFNQGEIITKSVCQERVKVLKLIWQEDYLSSPANKQIIVRMLQNLINIYHNKELFDLKEYLEAYVNIIKRSS
jgi:regulator of sirC expression with transglutaminase-like and TPR domain